jgi:hypothetical protein
MKGNLTPDFSDTKYYQQQLKQTFNHNYEIKEIEEAFDLLLGQQEEELVVYPDDHIQGI